MTNHVTRLYALAASLLGFFLAWAGIAAHPWSRPQAGDPRTQAAASYEQRLRRDAVLVRQLVAQGQTRAAAPTVRIVTLPPLTTTRTS